MGKMRQTRRAMQFAGHQVGHITGKVERMVCSECGESVEVGKTHAEPCKPKPQEATS